VPAFNDNNSVTPIETRPKGGRLLDDTACSSRMKSSILIAGLVFILQDVRVAGLKIASALNTIEYTPELIAIKDYYKGEAATIVNGGVANLFTDTSIDLAANAETQALRQFATHKNLRTIYTVAEVYYRIVADKNKITSLKDLKGKKIGTSQGTSAAYFVQKYLAAAGIKESEYTVVSGSVCMAAPCGTGTFPYMLAHGTIDAVGMWEPTVQLAADALGAANAVIFQNKTVYREVYNLHSTAEKLKNPTTRKNIVAFLQALTQAEKLFENDPQSIWPRVSQAVGVNATLLREVWPVHEFRGTLAPDLLDVLTEEDQWVAKTDRRTAVSRSDLASLIDDSVLKEALQSR
jgi:ABC-type nitrate/sulfonate/bicarbonate transport system substrate-binding protein